jgi:hypothetical protein
LGSELTRASEKSDVVRTSDGHRAQNNVARPSRRHRDLAPQAGRRVGRFGAIIVDQADAARVSPASTTHRRDPRSRTAFADPNRRSITAPRAGTNAQAPQRENSPRLEAVHALELEVTLRTDPAAIAATPGFKRARFCAFGLTTP